MTFFEDAVGEVNAYSKQRIDTYGGSDNSRDTGNLRIENNKLVLY